MNELAERWAKVGRAVVARREKLHMQQIDLVRASELSDLTVRRIENGEPANYWPDTKHRICRALQWTPNSIDRILEGKRPIIVVTPPADPFVALQGRVGGLEQAVRELLRIADLDADLWLREPRAEDGDEL